MLYRRKILLSLLELFGNNISKLEAHKYLFLFSNLNKNILYEFIPHKYGCYSYTLASDIRALEKQALVALHDDKIYKTCSQEFLECIDIEDAKNLGDVFRQASAFGNFENMMRHVYTTAPFYAINSIVKEKYLNKNEIEFVYTMRPVISTTSLATIGYEGISIESYINKLIKNDIRCLVDVRRNPHSMKFGFSGSRLKSICEETGIAYVSIRELGIDADKRKKLETQEDYENLFRNYTHEILEHTDAAQKRVLELLENYGRIALTCFEKDINSCHRKVLSEYLQKKYKPVGHIDHL
ncbi:MAG: hypothetical protein CVV44_11880 [Spirochaetae bacterium HGW-Spirochaetae-1]|jgi:ribosomal protein L13E|nr:MAG: hypothetical protein CVV44_11880 [Spirochaetae bacterium HGW-Spirochaetae-1]